MAMEAEERKPKETGPESRLFSAAQQELADIEANQRRAEAEGQEEIADLWQHRKELFWAEHDNAGAFKIKKFDRQLREAFTGRGEKEPTVARKPDGTFEAKPTERERRFLFVDMLELDRLNKEGGSHDAGDAGLAETVRIISEIAGARRGDAGVAPEFEVLRSGGNQFMVSFEEIGKEDLKEIADAIAERRADISGTVGKTVEGAPLSVTSVDIADVIEDLNAIQAESGIAFETGDEAAREAMQILLRSSDWGGEVRKFATRTDRVKELLDAKAAGKAVDVQGFFDNYVSKSVKGTPFETLEGFKLILEGGAYEENVREAALSAARSRFELGRGFEDAEDASVTERVRKEVVRARIEARQAGAGGDRFKGERDEVGTAEPPERTHGQEILEALKKTADHDEKALKEAVAAKADSGEIARLRLIAENAKLDYDIEYARRNPDTGLLERGVYYENLQKAIEDERPSTAVFIDMGFLKYFDQKGGRDVGDAALKSAAHLIEQALEEAGLKGEAYRYGGDEFTVRFDGGKKDAPKFMAALSRLKESFGKIARGPKSKDEYAPSELQFNYGVSDTAELMDVLRETGREDTTANAKAELLTKIADQRVEYSKAVSRFDYLLGEMRKPGFKEGKYGAEEPTEGPKTAETIQTDSKIEFSRKALFAELGGEAALRIFADELKRAQEEPEGREGLEEEVEDQIRRFVLDRIEESRKKDAESRRLLDRLLEARTKVDFLESEVDDLKGKLDGEHQRVKELEATLSAARKDLEALKSVRGQLAA